MLNRDNLLIGSCGTLYCFPEQKDCQVGSQATLCQQPLLTEQLPPGLFKTVFIRLFAITNLNEL